jgi:Zn-dependent membrane protease YugP
MSRVSARQVVLLLVIGSPIAAAFVLMASEVAARWLAVVVALVPSVVILVARVLSAMRAPLLAAGLRDSAATWVQRQIAQLGMAETLTVAALEEGDHRDRNFYHLPTRTIVLSDRVHGEHTVRARAIAAHELGHAVFHIRAPVSRLLMGCRLSARPVYNTASGLLIGTALAGETLLARAILPLFVAAAALMAMVVVDEAIASAAGLRYLRQSAELDGDEQRGAIIELLVALAEYGACLVGYLAPVVGWPWIVDWLGGGRPLPGPALVGVARTIGSVTGIMVVAGGLGALASALLAGRPCRRIRLGSRIHGARAGRW